MSARLLLTAWLATTTVPAAAQAMDLVSRAHAALIPDSAGRNSTGRVDTRHQALSADGRYAVFASTAWNLIDDFVGSNPFAHPPVENVYLRDRLTGATTLVSHALGQPNVSGNWASDRAVISADGSTIAFFSQATNLTPLAPGTGPDWGLYVFERATGAVRLAGHAADEPLVRGAVLASEQIGISSDGRFLAFVGLSTPWVTGQVCPNGQTMIVLWDRATDTHALVSHPAGSPSACALGASREPSLSLDGRYVAYDSTATDLVAGQNDGNLALDVFAYDRLTDANHLISRSVAGPLVAGNARSMNARLSADGGFIAFDSQATDLVVRQVTPLPSRGHVFLAERASGALRLVSHAPSAPHHAANDGSYQASLSADGRFVAFSSFASDLLPGLTKTEPGSDVYLYDRADASLKLVSQAAGQPLVTANDISSNPLVSRDGCCVAFWSFATNLVAGQVGGSNVRSSVMLWERAGARMHLASHAAGKPSQVADGFSGSSFNVPDGLSGASFDLDAGANTVYFPSNGTDVSADALDLNGGGDVLAWRRADDAAELLSRRAAGQPSLSANRFSNEPTTSADGQVVAFLSSAGNLAWAFEPSRNGFAQVFVRDRGTGTTRLASGVGGSATRACESTSTVPLVSADGSVVVFLNKGSDLLPGWTNEFSRAHVFAFDRGTGVLRAVSHAAGQPNTPATGTSRAVSVSADGRFIAFVSEAPDLVAGQIDTPFHPDVFLHDRSTGLTQLVSHASTSAVTAGNGGSDLPAVSADGRYVAFVSGATNLQAGQTTTPGLERNVFLFDRLSGAVTLVSRALSAPLVAAGAGPDGPSIDDAGTRVAFQSAATNLVAGQVDTPGTFDVFAWQRSSGQVALASRSAAGALVAGNGPAHAPRLSGNGRFVAFESNATDVVAGQVDGNGGSDVIVHDLLTSASRLASRASGSPTTTANASSTLTGLSVDGGRVLFVSAATDVVAGQVLVGSGGPHAFVYTSLTGDTLLASRSRLDPARPGDVAIGSARLSGDGGAVVFDGGATDHVAGDYNLWSDVFAFALPAPLTR